MGYDDLSWGPVRSRAAWALPIVQVLLGARLQPLAASCLCSLLGREMQPLPHPWHGVPAWRLFEFPIHGNIPAESPQRGAGEALQVWESEA